MVTGVESGFRRSLELVGVGYRVQQSEQTITLQVGFSHNVNFAPPDGVKLEIEGINRIHVDGIDKQAVGEVAARIKKIRPPNPYTGKGVRYLGEQIKLRPGKTGGRRA
jgi:large subunit ribosomal protein L6